VSSIGVSGGAVAGFEALRAAFFSFPPGSRVARSRPDLVRVTTRMTEEAEGSMMIDFALVEASWRP